jgi:xanthine dehydrogenase accessory factor
MSRHHAEHVVTDVAACLVVVRGGGDLGTGVAWRLRRVGFPVVVLELERPLAIRRTVAFSSAVDEGRVEIDGIEGLLVASPEEAVAAAGPGVVPVLISEVVPALPVPVSVLVDARVAKKALDSRMGQAPFVVGLGPGFVVGVHCDAVIETMRGHRLGSVIWNGSAVPNTGVPGELGGAAAERVIHAEAAGYLAWDVGFGDMVEAGQRLGSIGSAPVTAKIGGTVRGMIAPGEVTAGLKIADVDPRRDADMIDHISDKALSVAGGALEAILVWLNRSGR